MEATPPATRQEPPLPSVSSETAPSARPPHPLDGKWSMNVDGQTYGPYTGHELKEFAAEGRLDGQTQIKRVGGFDWLPAIRDQALSAFLAPDTSGPPPLAATRNDAPPKVSARDGGTVVQVTNNIQQPNMAVLLDPGANKSPFLAAVLSLLIVGVGQCYNGQWGKGIVFFILAIGLWTVLLGWIFNLWSIIDAYSVAKDQRTKYERRLAAGYA